ncbi:hypothetical protein EHQ12_04745 [Leptospira gomenensis]|uniref:Uncharacterized protein n=1 Tax=Leptospira gomenensis TaxID=2484974 RepID=A0A5F1YIK1_9LEPT|nr:hypothetical protein [Leptospira gomenensis]TGK38441.1 hypothetical protein EHQ17_02020 [Leptospira gomenensis]TGK42556.1 hypothetical protein EHQ07_14115 [Leptospira gomenensis]TGK42811.1 hypothetical protein EHQ12_04745 [Leptospira gomenensis]TGK55804.1 hypothetical protein EHQ13_16135 [Leptospira gomenensis]
MHLYFLMIFFAALPAWFLSTLEGWITVDCTRAAVSSPMECTVGERFAFSSRNTRYATWKARSASLHRHDRRGSSVSYQLVLSTASGEVPVLRSSTGSDKIERIARDLNAAIGAGSTRFSAEAPPDSLFWFASFLVFLFAGVGALIALVGKRSGKS